MGAGETNLPEKEPAATRREGEPLTRAAQERRPDGTAAAEHQAAGELASPSQGKKAVTDIPHKVCLDPGAGDQVDGGRCRSDTAETVQVEPPLTDRDRGWGRIDTPHLRFKTPADPIPEGWDGVLYS
jgi:hypothetical protein